MLNNFSCARAGYAGVKGIPKKVNITCVSLGKQDNRGDKLRGENQNLLERRTINISDRGGQRANPLTGVRCGRGGGVLFKCGEEKQRGAILKRRLTAAPHKRRTLGLRSKISGRK
jgi:hypothetical protein